MKLFIIRQVVQDELLAQQLEFTLTEERNRQLKLENERLVQRWLAHLEERAEKLNDENEQVKQI